MSVELEKAQRALDQAKARFQKVQGRERERERKKDARRKIIIGGAILKLIASQPAENRSRTVASVLRFVSEKDRQEIQPVLEEIISETRSATTDADADGSP